MGSRLTPFLIFFLAFTGMQAQNQWIPLYFPDTLHIKCITTNDYGDIFVGVGYDNEQGGVLRSTDDGLTWELVYDDGFFGILSITIGENGQLFAGSSNGFCPLVMSTDNGNSWEGIPTPTGYVGNVTEVEFHKDELYINMWGSLSSLFRTADLGLTWDTLFSSYHGPSENITSIKFDGEDHIFLSIMGFQNNTGGVYRSNDNGITWDLMGLFNHQVSGMDINNQSDIFTCDWFLISGNNCGINAWYADSSSFSLVRGGAGFRDLKINSEGDIFSCGTGGVLYSEDNGNSFQHFDSTMQSYIDYIHISHNDYVYISHNAYIARSSLTTSTRHHTGSDSDEEPFTVYPNPTADHLCIHLNPVINEIVEVRIYNPFGHCVQREQQYYGTTPISMDVSPLSAGMYIMEINTGTTSYQRRFVKAKR